MRFLSILRYITRFGISLVFSTLLLLGCGGGNGRSGSVSEALHAMEASGQLPVLDRTNTVTGVDADSNGVRDDLDAYIAGLPDTALEKSALAQMARSINSTMTVDVTNDTALGVAAEGLRDAVNCIWRRYVPTAASKKVDEIRKIMVNTRQRYDAYARYNLARSGSVVDIPTGDTCR